MFLIWLLTDRKLIDFYVCRWWITSYQRISWFHHWDKVKDWYNNPVVYRRELRVKIESKLESAELKTFVLTLLPIKLLLDKHQNHRLLGHVSNFVVKFNSTVNDMKAGQSMPKHMAFTRRLQNYLMALLMLMIKMVSMVCWNYTAWIHRLQCIRIVFHTFVCIVTDEFKPYKRETAIGILTRKRVMLISYQT